MEQKKESLNVYQAIAKVQAALAKEGIAKDRKNEQQNFKFRGIDDVYNALAGLLAEYGLCILPRVISRTVTERATKSGGVLFYVVLDVEYDFISAADASKHTVRICGEAMDSGDKASNKALSAAYKYACLQTFCIPTEGDNDADGTTHEVAAAKSIFDTPELRETFTVNTINSITLCKTVAELKTIKELSLARLQAMKASENPADVEAFNRIIAVYNPLFIKYRDAEAKLAPQQPQTVDSLVKPIVAALGDDTIDY